MLLGAAIGSQINQVWLVAPLAAASHFIIDMFPHEDWVVEVEVEDLNKKSILVIIADILIALGLVYLLARGTQNWELMWLGALCAGLPDVHHILHVLFGPEKFKKYSRAHGKFHWDKDLRFIPGVAAQAAVGVLSVWAIVSSR
jgi:hypothetical protein